MGFATSSFDKVVMLSYSSGQDRSPGASFVTAFCSVEGVYKIRLKATPHFDTGVTYKPYIRLYCGIEYKYLYIGANEMDAVFETTFHLKCKAGHSMVVELSYTNLRSIEIDAIKVGEL